MEGNKELIDGEIFGLDGGSKRSSLGLLLMPKIFSIFISQSSPQK